MREIKFRGLSTDGNGWAYGWAVGKCYIIPEDATITHTSMGDLVMGIETIIPETVGQFTGLLDKNGKDIYEGDLFRYYTGISIVGWNDKLASFCLKREGWASDHFDHFFHKEVEHNDGEVIGNIHEKRYKTDLTGAESCGII